jgi:hypothetical protein
MDTAVAHALRSGRAQCAPWPPTPRCSLSLPSSAGRGRLARPHGPSPSLSRLSPSLPTAGTRARSPWPPELALSPPRSRCASTFPSSRPSSGPHVCTTGSTAPFSLPSAPRSACSSPERRCRLLWPPGSRQLPWPGRHGLLLDGPGPGAGAAGRRHARAAVPLALVAGEPPRETESGRQRPSSARCSEKKRKKDLGVIIKLFQGSCRKDGRDKENVGGSAWISTKYRVPDAKCVFFLLSFPFRHK